MWDVNMSVRQPERVRDVCICGCRYCFSDEDRSRLSHLWMEHADAWPAYQAVHLQTQRVLFLCKAVLKILAYWRHQIQTPPPEPFRGGVEHALQPFCQAQNINIWTDFLIKHGWLAVLGGITTQYISILVLGLFHKNITADSLILHSSWKYLIKRLAFWHVIVTL